VHPDEWNAVDDELDLRFFVSLSLPSTVAEMMRLQLRLCFHGDDFRVNPDRSGL
jgi:hypothetical protein